MKNRFWIVIGVFFAATLACSQATGLTEPQSADPGSTAGGQPTSAPDQGEGPQPTPSAEPVFTATQPPVTPSPAPTETPVPTPTPSPPPYPLFGIQPARLTVPYGLNEMTQSGTYWARGSVVFWSNVEPSPGARNWGAMARAEQDWLNAAENGLAPIVTVGFAPHWAQHVKGVSCGPVALDQAEAFGAFMHDVVARYSQPPYNVKYWEIWNEPDIQIFSVPSDNPWGCWGNQDEPFFGGRHYGEILKAVYPQMKAADPEAQLLVGGLLMDCDPTNPPEFPFGSGQIRDCSSSTFLTGILESGGGDFFDGISFHAYDYYANEFGKYGNLNWHSTWNLTGPVLITKAAYLRDVLGQYGHPDKYLINTEVALLCGRDGTEAVCRTEDFSATKAYYLTQAYAAAAAVGLRANVWYSLTGWRGSGLVSQALNPYPAFRAYQFSAQQLTGAAFWGEVADYAGVKGYRFNRDGREFWVLWSFDGEPHTVELPSPPNAVYDVFGDPLPGGQTMEITLAPVYLVWE